MCGYCGGVGYRRNNPLPGPRPGLWGEQLSLDARGLRLRFVASHDLFSQYVDEDGAPVYLAHGTAARLVAIDDIIERLDTLWAQWEISPDLSLTFDDFLEWLRTLTFEPQRVYDDIYHCHDCGVPEHVDESYYVTDIESRVCESCFGDYYTCDYCEESYRNTTTNHYGRETCNYCLSEHFTYCGDCGGYVRNDDSDHYHDDDDCCEAPRQLFSMRNDGHESLSNDTRVTVALPAGTISPEGLTRIGHLLRGEAETTDDYDESVRMRSLSWQLDQLGDRWQAKDGNYTKRLSRLAYKSFGIKLSPEIVSAVGNIAREHASNSPEYHVEVTRNLNLSAADFYHEGSCWFGRGEYAVSRCALKTSGGLGLRTFGDYGVTGRAWVMPLRLNDDDNLRPTCDTLTPDAFVVFNGYGALEGYAPARIVAHMAGWTYRKISFECEPMYVNNSTAYLIAPEHIAEEFSDDGRLYLTVDQHSNLYETESVNV